MDIRYAGPPLLVVVATPSDAKMGVAVAIAIGTELPAMSISASAGGGRWKDIIVDRCRRDHWNTVILRTVLNGHFLAIFCLRWVVG